MEVGATNWEASEDARMDEDDDEFIFYDSESGTCNKWQLLEEELTCVCCGNLFVGPKTVPCLHTFCSNCVESSVDAETGDFTCAVCGTVFSKEEIADIPGNASISHLVAITKKHKTVGKSCEKAFDQDASDLTVACGQCDEGAPAIWWCLVCDDAEMCEECYKCHCRLKVYKSHKVVPLRDFMQSPDVVLNCAPQPDYCKEHSKNPLDYYCNSCRKFVCTACPCLTSGSQKKHEVGTAINVYEMKRNEIKDMNETLWSLLQNADKAIQNNETTEQQLSESVTKEIEWAHQTFEEIRKLVDQHEEDILSMLKLFKSTKRDMLAKQKTSFCEFKKRLSQYAQFTSSILFPFRSKELLTYSEWITNKVDELTQQKSLDLAGDDNTLKHGSFSIDKLDHELSLLHHMCFPPHLPYCTASLLNETLEFVQVEVLLRDQQNHPVSYQLPYLDFKSDQPEQFFIDVDWEYKEKGAYILSYTPSKKLPHKLGVTWNNSVIHEIKVWEEKNFLSGFLIQEQSSFSPFLSKASFDIIPAPPLISFDHVHPPYCKINVMTNTLSFVEAEVILNDKQNHPVSSQVGHLSMKPEIKDSFYMKVEWKYKENGVHSLSCKFTKKKTQKLIITWKNEILGEIKMEGSLFHYPIISYYTSIMEYNKKRKRRNLRLPKFLANSMDALIVCDPDDHRLILFDSYYCYDSVINNGNQIGFTPSGIALDSYGHLHVVIPASNSIMKFKKHDYTPSIISFLNDRGCSFSSFSSSCFAGRSLSEDDNLQNPQGIVVSKCGFMYICSQGNNHIQVYYIPEDGKGEFRFSYCGQEDNAFNHPTDVALNTIEDKLFVTDTDNDRVQVFTIDDPSTAEITYSYSIEHTNMQSPFGVFCTVDSEVFVSAKDNVFVFNEDGTYVFAIDFKDKDPTGVTVNQRGMLVVALSRDGKVVFYS